MTFDIQDAVEVAAGDRQDQISADIRKARRASREVARVRAAIVRFLEALPEELTVFELKEQLERNAPA